MWSYITGSHVSVLWWHTSHELAVRKWFDGFGVAHLPAAAWQLAQCPGPTPVWAYLTGNHANALWH